MGKRMGEGKRRKKFGLGIKIRRFCVWKDMKEFSDCWLWLNTSTLLSYFISGFTG